MPNFPFNPLAAAQDVLDALPKPPTPAEVVKRLQGLVTGVPVSSIFDEKDFAGFVVIFGDAKRDGRIDVRMIPLRGAAGASMTALPEAMVGPVNVPITDAIEMGVKVAGMLPPAGASGVTGALAVMAIGAGAVEKFLLSGT